MCVQISWPGLEFASGILLCGYDTSGMPLTELGQSCLVRLIAPAHQGGSVLW